MSIILTSVGSLARVSPINSFCRSDYRPSFLEKIPFLLLETIFNHLGKRELLNICLVSKSLYFPAVKRLFLKISITDNNFEAAYAENQMRRCSIYHCTIIKSSKVKNLLRVIKKNDFHATLIHSIKVVSAIDITLIPQLLLHTRLKYFYHKEHFKLPPEAIYRVESITLPVSVRFTYPPNIVELKLLYFAGRDDHEDYEKLATALIESNGYHHLQSLKFQLAEEKLKSQCLVDSISPKAPWTIFFEVFERKKIKLNLVGLGLDGDFEDKGEKIAGLISRVVPLCNLASLDLSYSEQCHTREAPFDHKNTFLEAITSNSPSLQYLVIKPTENCKICQLNSVIVALKDNIPNQLKQLSISIAPPKDFDADSVRRAILLYQQNLLRLKFEDTSTSWYQLKQVLKALDFGQFLKWSKFSDNKSNLFPDRILDYSMDRKYFHPTKIELLKICKPQIETYLNKDLIFMNASASLPFMTEYWVLDFCIDMKIPGIIANENIISFK